MTVKERLTEFIKIQGLKVSEFEKRCCLSNGYVSSMRKSLGESKLNNVLKEFPQLNREWLLYGEGEMLRPSEGNASLVGTAGRAIIEDTKPVRFFEVTPSATFQDFCAGASETPSVINIIPAVGESLDESYCVFEVSGESMTPQIQPRARVLCQEIPPTRWHQLSDCIVVIAYADRFVIKRIITNMLSSRNYIVLASDNPDYPDREIVQLADIRAIFTAKRIISSAIV